MENIQQNDREGVTPLSAMQQSKVTANTSTDSSEHTLVINCAIRRRPALVGLPGTDPNDRVYKIGSSIDQRTKKNLKGIEGELEEKFMPSIVGISHKDNSFQEKINEYWGNISSFIPAEDTVLRDELRGKVLRIQCTVKGKANKDKIESEVDIEKKVELIKKGVEKGLITIDFNDVPDFVLLAYCLRYSRVAKDVSLLDMSPKILFYIYNKAAAVKTKLNTIELRNKAIQLFTGLKDDEQKVNALLVMFNLLPTDFDDLDDKLIALDLEYNKSFDTMRTFVDYCEDKNLNMKFLIAYAVQKGKLNRPSNTDSYYYNQVMIGRSLEDAVLYLNDEGNAEAGIIKENLIKETKD